MKREKRGKIGKEEIEGQVRKGKMSQPTKASKENEREIKALKKEYKAVKKEKDVRGVLRAKALLAACRKSLARFVLASKMTRIGAFLCINGGLLDQI